MRKKLFALFAVFFMVLVTFGTISVNAEPTGTLYGTVFFEYENDWGETIVQPLGGVLVTIIRSDGDSRTATTDATGYYSRTVNFEKYESYVVSVATIPEYTIGTTTYKLFGTSEGATIRTIDKIWGAKQVLINMPAKEVEAESEPELKSLPIITNNIFPRGMLFKNMIRGVLESLKY